MNNAATLPKDYRERTLSMITDMDDQEARTVYFFVSDIVKNNPSNPFRPMSTDEIKKDLELSKQQFKEGKVTDTMTIFYAQALREYKKKQ